MEKRRARLLENHEPHRIDEICGIARRDLWTCHRSMRVSKSKNECACTLTIARRSNVGTNTLTLGIFSDAYADFAPLPTRQAQARLCLARPAKISAAEHRQSQIPIRLHR